MANPLSIDELFHKIDEAETYRKQAIELLLQEREAINQKLARLGYMGTPAQVHEAKKRIRRTKAQIESERANTQGSGAHGKKKATGGAVGNG
jgi:hypothetical protein